MICHGTHPDVDFKTMPITIDQEPTKDANADPATYTFPAGAITKVNGRDVKSWGHIIGSHLNMTVGCVAVCSALLGAALMWLVKR